MNVALVPAKPLRLAKTRLGPLLGDAARAAVSAAMLDDVLAALARVRRLDRILVVTADPRLAARARWAGAVVIDEGGPRGLNHATTIGIGAARDLGASTLVVLLSDIPLVEPADVDELLDRAPTRGVLVVPSKEGTGTNAIVRRPAAAVPPCFGGRSLERHVTVAERRRLPCVIWRNTRLGFDVDTPEDLQALAAAAADRTATHAVALRLGIATQRPLA